MEDSIDFIRDNGDDNDTPLKQVVQVVQLCSIPAGKRIKILNLREDQRLLCIFTEKW